MQIRLTSILVDDQDKAQKFYTDVLGFITAKDIPLGEYKWLTVVSPEAPDEIELLLEPNSNPAARMYQQALFELGIPLTAFEVTDIQEEYARMLSLGVVFRTPPKAMGSATIAAFEDTCGNVIQIYQM